MLINASATLRRTSQLTCPSSSGTNSLPTTTSAIHTSCHEGWPLPGADSYKEVDVHSRLLIIGAVALFSGSPVPVFDSCPTDDFEIDPWPDKKGWRFEYVAKPATAYR
jgi:hypothetical protein